MSGGALGEQQEAALRILAGKYMRQYSDNIYSTYFLFLARNRLEECRMKSNPKGMKIYYSHYLLYFLLTMVLLTACQNRNTPVPNAGIPPEPLLDTVESHLRERNYRQLRQLALERLKDDDFEENHDEALYLLIVVHSTPESPYFDLDQARDFTRQLEENHPASPYSLQAKLLHDFGHQLQEHQMLVKEVQQMSRRLKGSRNELMLSIRSLKKRIESLKSEKTILENHLGLRQQEVEALSEELAAARARSRELAEELRLLKEIDLKQRDRSR